MIIYKFHCRIDSVDSKNIFKNNFPIFLRNDHPISTFLIFLQKSFENRSKNGVLVKSDLFEGDKVYIKKVS